MERSDLFVLGFVWAMTVSALVVGPRETLLLSGLGIPPEHVPDLFVPFSRDSESSDTGLGLAIARAIVEAYDGSLTYRLPEGDRPHAFVVSLPSSPEPEPA